MHTVSDLDDVLRDLDAHVGADAAAVADAVAQRVRDATSARHPTRRRSGYLIAAACATVAAVAVIPTLLVDRGTHRVAGPTSTAPIPGGPLSTTIQPPSPGQSPPLRFGFRLRLPAGYVYRIGGISAVSENMTVGRGGLDAYSLEVYTQGSFDPSNAQRGEPVVVGGHQGYYGKVLYPGQSVAVLRDSVIWQYAPNSWAAVWLSTERQIMPGAPAIDVKAETLVIANSVREGTMPMRLPFRLASVPAGVVVRSLGASLLFPPAAGPINGSVTFGTGRSAAATIPLDLMVQSVALDSKFCTSQYWAKQTLDIGRVDQATFGENPGCLLIAKSGDAAGAFVRLGRYYAEIHVWPDHYGEFTPEQIRQLAAGVSVAPQVADPSTWFDATTAIPQ